MNAKTTRKVIKRSSDVRRRASLQAILWSCPMNRPSNPSTTAALANRGDGAAVSPLTVAPSFPCRSCQGKGEAQYMALDEERFYWRTCWDCEGSGVEEPYCGVCNGELTCDLFCTSCDEYESLVYVERISPTRVAL